MSQPRSLEANLAALDALRADPRSGLTIERLCKALASKSNHLIARAAQMAGEYEIETLERDLAQAFERLLDSPFKADKGCDAKIALAEALYHLGCDRESLFLRGIHHIQLEPVYGGKEDTAARLRAVCALGLVGMNHPQTMVELAHLLADPEMDARIGAVRALAHTQPAASVPLLRFKVLIGDVDSRVLYQCFRALLTLSPESSLAFVARFLGDEDVAVGESAAIALGESRLGAAFEFLKAGWERALEPSLRRAILYAIAMLRHEQAIDFLLSLVAEGSPAIARGAIAALEMYRQDGHLWRRVEQLVRARDDIHLPQALAGRDE